MKKIFALFASLLLVFSCSKMDEPEITPDTPDENTSVSAQSFSASLEIPTTHPKSKTTLSANGDGTYKICWGNGDVITVTGGSNTAYYSTTSTTTRPLSS